MEFDLLYDPEECWGLILVMSVETSQWNEKRGDLASSYQIIPHEEVCMWLQTREATPLDRERVLS